MVTHEIEATERRAATPAETYEARATRFAALRALYDQRSDFYGKLNILFFFGALAALVFGFVTATFPLLALAPLLFVAFVFSFRRTGQIMELRDHYAALVAINEEGLSRLRRDWAALPLRQPEGPPPDSLYAGDLDLLGHASLHHLLNSANTPAGQATLQRWLLEPAPPATARARQAALRELAPANDLRDELGVRGRRLATLQRSYESFLTWAEGDSWLLQRPALIWTAWALPILTVVLLAAQLAGLTRYPLWLLSVIASYLVHWLLGKEVEERLDAVSDRQGVFRPYAALFQLLERQRFTAPALRQTQAALTTGGRDAGDAMTQLAAITRFGDLRLSMFGPLVKIGLLWNFHALWRLERWQRRSGRDARGWLETLGVMEAFAALATLPHDAPDWAYPELLDQPALAGQPVLVARDLAHPLLRPEAAVSNDVALGPVGTFLLVTGSNMSGKSTLLRAIGVNIVLAQAGAPVAARSMRLAPVQLATSIRVQDSLEQGVSYYMAELRRLKDVVESAQQTRAGGDRTALFLLDEILHGTNTSERQIAARRIITYLLDLGATGAVSTHDLTLADTPALAARSQQAHFTEDFSRGTEGPVMRFDYRLRPGVATSSNALKLMEIVGLPLGAPDA